MDYPKLLYQTRRKYPLVYKGLNIHVHLYLVGSLFWNEPTCISILVLAAPKALVR